MRDDSHRQKQTLLVGKELTGERLDLFLVGALPGSSRKAVKAALDGGMVFIDGRVQRRANYRLQGGEVVHVTLAACPRSEPGGDDLRELYRDSWLLAVDKPAGIPCHPTGTGGEDILSRLAARLQREGHCEAPVLLHRLDLETSGVLLFALNREGNRSLQHQFTEHRVEKVYLAVTAGHAPVNFRIDNRLGRGRRGRMVSVTGTGGQQARTDFRLLNRGEGWSLVEARPRTGRTHQIRVHLAEAGFPLLGDRLYHGPTALAVKGGMIHPGRCLLHAEKITFHHPDQGREMTLKAPIPMEFDPFLPEEV
ncbi:MAG: RluA family pseudouridine synthase [Syntrophotaleaceae bacterium]